MIKKTNGDLSALPSANPRFSLTSTKVGQNTALGISYGVKDSLVGILSIRHLYLGGKNEAVSGSSSKTADQTDKRSNSYLSNKTSQQHKKQNIARSNIIYCCLLNGGIFLVSCPCDLAVVSS